MAQVTGAHRLRPIRLQRLVPPEEAGPRALAPEAAMEDTAGNAAVGSYGTPWVESRQRVAFPPLSGDVTVDVAVIGGGMVGMSAAHVLKESGLRVAVLEARQAGRQVTGGSTVKVTCQHGLIYSQLQATLGAEAARLYGEANRAGFEHIRRTATEAAIDCEWETRASYVYSQGDDGLAAVQREAEVAAELGLPANFCERTPLPFPVAGAVRFDGQAQFHPVGYVDGLARAVAGQGHHVFENTRVLDVDGGSPCRVMTGTGTVIAEHVIVATNLPVLDRGGFFAKCRPQRHMALAVEVDEAPEGMFLSTDTPSRSIRTWHTPDGRPILIAVGGAFRPGHGDEQSELEDLATWVRANFRVRDILWHWGNQDYVPMDGVPYVGGILPGAERLLVATGFNAWGMTNAAAAALMMRDHILARSNPWRELFDATRLNLGSSTGTFVKQNLHVGSDWLSGRVRKPSRQASDLKPGEGAVAVGSGGDTVAAYCDAEGSLHQLSPKCAHMGCIVHWNDVESSWDCPCHGSRFTATGEVIQGPAVSPLARR